MQTYNLPDVGEGLTEAEIVQWHVKPGDAVAVNDVVAEIETAKSLVELPSPFAGTVSPGFTCHCTISASVSPSPTSGKL